MINVYYTAINDRRQSEINYLIRTLLLERKPQTIHVAEFGEGKVNLTVTKDHGISIDAESKSGNNVYSGSGFSVDYEDDCYEIEEVLGEIYDYREEMQYETV